MLEQVKAGLGITGTYQDSTIQLYIDEVKQFLIDGGVDRRIIEADSSIGIITRGVADLWNYGSGGTSFSPYFLQRATQLALKEVITPDDPDFYYTKEEVDRRLAAINDTTDTLDNKIESLFIQTNVFSFVTTEGQTTFNFTGEYDTLDVLVNHLQLNISDYTINDNTIVLNKDLKAGQNVEIILYRLNKEGA